MIEEEKGQNRKDEERMKKDDGCKKKKEKNAVERKRRQNKTDAKKKKKKKRYQRKEVGSEKNLFVDAFFVLHASADTSLKKEGKRKERKNLFFLLFSFLVPTTSFPCACPSFLVGCLILFYLLFFFSVSF